MNNMDYLTWVEVNLSAVRHNVNYYVQTAGVPLMAVVKADAYGFGACEISKCALESGAQWLGVARYCEARALRKANISAPILVLGMVTPDEVDEAIQNDVTLTLHDPEVAKIYSKRAETCNKCVQVHLKIDTGMGRLGVFYQDVVSLAEYIRELNNIEITGIFSHFAMAEDILDHPLTFLQLERFNKALQSLNAIGISPQWIHCSNSGATVFAPDARFTLVRVGAGLVSIKPVDWGPFPSELRRVMTWKTRLVSSKIVPKGWAIGYGQEYKLNSDEKIGVLAIGYADGFHNKPGNEVLIEGKRVPTVGRVCCDLCMVKLPNLYPIGTEVVLLGDQGNESINIEDLAVRWKLSDADITALINQRVPRVYTTD